MLPWAKTRYVVIEVVEEIEGQLIFRFRGMEAFRQSIAKI